MMQYRCRDGEMLDQICQKYYGFTQGATEYVLDRNPHLADLGPRYRAGLVILLPDLPDSILKQNRDGAETIAVFV